MLSRVLFVAVFAACAVTACIFDSGGDYPGGGRRDIGASLIENGGEEPEEDGGNGGGGEGEGEDGGSDPFADVFGGGGG